MYAHMELKNLKFSIYHNADSVEIEIFVLSLHHFNIGAFKNIQSMKENCFELVKSICDSFNALDFENPFEKRFTYYQEGCEFYIHGLQRDLSMLLVLFQYSICKGFVFRLDSHFDDFSLRLVCRAL